MAFLFKQTKKNSIENRPWGNFETLNSFPVSKQAGNAVIKKITVNPLNRLSYQSHTKRSEHWYVIQGQGKVTLNDKVSSINLGQSIDISIGTKHRIENTDKNVGLIFIEISLGDFAENDIIRYEDDYGRK